MPMVSRSEFLPWLPAMGRKTLFALALLRSALRSPFRCYG